MLSLVRRLAPTTLSARRLYVARNYSTQVEEEAPPVLEGEAHIQKKLTEHFNPSELLVQDLSGALRV